MATQAYTNLNEPTQAWPYLQVLDQTQKNLAGTNTLPYFGAL
jgi:hypothetical protein